MTLHVLEWILGGITAIVALALALLWYCIDTAEDDPYDSHWLTSKKDRKKARK